ncbi:MAG: hypothetical protein HC822_07800 [Oscillochloris sp.]|nr:hypothetical protein [Oscillochloris sp.]
MNLTTAEIPQADVLWDVARVPEAILRGHSSPDAIGIYLGTKSQRQGHYYTQAARVIGLVEPGDAGEPAALTKFGRAFAYYNRIEQRTALRRQLLRYEPTRSVVATVREQDGLDRRGVAQVLQQLAPLASSTAFRRAATVAAWLCEVGLAEWDAGLLRYCGPSLPIGPATLGFVPAVAPGG